MPGAPQSFVRCEAPPRGLQRNPADPSPRPGSSTPLPPARREWFPGLVLALLCGTFFYGLNAGQLYRTEGLRAIIAAEMLRSGDWVVPRLYGEPLLTKPPGMYAAIALVSWPFGGVNQWSARLPSALAATAAVLLFYCHFRRVFGPRGGLVAAAVLPSSFLWLDKATSAEIDMLQTTWVAAAVLFFLRAVEAEEEDAKVRGLWWLAALLCTAGGFLTKWTAPAFFYGTAVPLLWWRGRLRLLFGRRHLASAAVAATLCLGWAAAAVHRAGWDTFSETVGREALQRLSHRHYQAARPVALPGHEPLLPMWAEVLAHPFVLLAVNLPWSAIALLALRPGFAGLWDERGRRLLQGLHCWVWPNLLFWSVIPEHAVRHSFPLFPGLSGLAAVVWLGWLTGKLRPPLRLLPPGPTLAVVVALWLTAKVVFVHAVMPARAAHREPRAKGERLAAAVPPGQPLYLFRLKDEGILFYYTHRRPHSLTGPPVLRLPGPEGLPSSSEPLYCILQESEWRQWRPTLPAGVVLHLHDEQGAPIVLVRVGGDAPGRPPTTGLGS